MYNEFFSIGPVTIHGYGLMIGIGVAVALLMGDYRAKKKGLDGDLIYGLTITTVILGFLCARVLFILTEWRAFVQDPKSFITGSGFVVYGGIIGGLLVIYGYCKLKKMDFLSYLDLMIPSVAMAQGFGRIGCFLAGCCYGKETECFLGVTFTNSAFAPNGVKLLPSQLFMATGDFILAAVLIWFAAKKPLKGKVSALYLILYSIGRFFVEFTRNDDRGVVGSLSTSQFIGIFVFAIGLLMYFVILPKVVKQPERVEETVTEEAISTQEKTDGE